MLGKIEGKKRRGMTENEMVGWHHQVSGHEFEQTLGDSERQGSLVCRSPWGCKGSDTTELLNNSRGKGNHGAGLAKQSARCSRVMTLAARSCLQLHLEQLSGSTGTAVLSTCI